LTRIAGPHDVPPWCPYKGPRCRNIVHIPVEFIAENESGFCVGQMKAPRLTVVPNDPVSPEHLNTHWLCIYSSAKGGYEFQINAGDMGLLAEVLLVALKDAQEGRLNFGYFERVVSEWPKRMIS